jgi:hypothetical protein
MSLILYRIQRHLNNMKFSVRSSKTSRRSTTKTVAFLALFMGISVAALSRTPVSVNSVPVRMIVTAAALHGGNPPDIRQEDVQVFQERERMKVTAWTPAQGSQAGLDLYILIDDSANSDLGGLLSDLRDFINAQPDTTYIAVGYLSHGTVESVQGLTNDHAQAAKSVRIPLGFRTSFDSPFLSLADAVKRLPDDARRHEFLVISSGIDLFRGFNFGLLSPDADTAIERAQRASAIVNTVYVEGTGRISRNYWVATTGQSNLGKVAAETGGIALAPPGIEEPINLKPFLDQVRDSLANQYLLEFQARPGKKAGFQTVRVETEVPNAELIAASSVYVPSPK